MGCFLSEVFSSSKKKKRQVVLKLCGVCLVCAQKTPRLAFPFKLVLFHGGSPPGGCPIKLSTSDRPFGFRRPSLRPSVTLIKAAQTNTVPDGRTQTRLPKSKPPGAGWAGPLGCKEPFPPGCAAAWLCGLFYRSFIRYNNGPSSRLPGCGAVAL